MEIRRGVTRTVLLTRLWAVKVPSLHSHGDGARGVLWSLARGLSANLSELQWSGTTGTCPVVWTLAGIVNVYPRCQPVDRELTDADYDGTGFIGPGDRKPQNLGLLDGRLVWLDYDLNWNDRLPCDHITRPRSVFRAVKRATRWVRRVHHHPRAALRHDPPRTA